MSHHQHKDSTSRFMERNLNEIVLHRKIEKWLKIALLLLACFMLLAVFFVYTLG